MKPVSVDDLRRELRYDPETGVFTRLVKRGNQRAGTIAGGVSKSGYLCVQFDGCLHRAHRLAWFYMKGAWPVGDIDHKNRDRLDNRWDNLREATRSQNNANRAATSAHGFKGACYNKRRGVWTAKIDVDRRQIHLGSYDTPEEAHAAYVAAAERFFGEFARAA